MSLNYYRLKFVSKIMRLLPQEMPGKARLARAFFGSCLKAKNIKIRDRYGCKFLVPNLCEPIGFHLLANGGYENKTLEFLLSRLREGDVLVDVGANIGVFTLPAAIKVGSRGCVLAVEPSPGIFHYLKQNVMLNGLSNVRLRQCAAFDRDSVTVLFWEAPIEHFGMGSLAAQFHDHPISVPAQTLDHILAEELIEHVDLLKVDVEGFEVAVFKGAEQLLAHRKPPVIVFEFCDWAEERVQGVKVGDSQRILRDYGYQIFRLSNFTRGYRRPLEKLLVKGYEMLVAVKDTW